MRLLLVTSSFPSGKDGEANAGVFVREVALRLAECGHHVEVVTPAAAGDFSGAHTGYSFSPIHWLGRDRSLTHLDPKRPTDALKLVSVMVMGALTVPWRARRSGAERIIAFWAVPSGIWAWGASRLLGTPFDVWALGSDIWRIDDYPCGRRGLRGVLRAADRCFGDGTDLVEEMSRIGDRPTAFLPSSRTLPSPSASIESRSPDRLRVTCIGRFHPHKGMDVLIQALALLDPEQQSSLDVAIHGFGPDEELLRRLIDERSLHEVVTLGGVLSPQEVSDLMTQTDLAVVPSRLESIPLILSDYCQCDVPLLVTDTGDMGELVGRHDAGITVPADSAPALAEGMVAVLNGSHTGTSAGRAALFAELGIGRSVSVLGDAAVDLGRSPV